MGRLHPAGHRLPPMVGGGFQPFGVLAIELQPAVARAEGLLPGAQEGIEAGAGGAEARPQLAIEQGLQQPGHQEPLGAGSAAAEAVAAFARIHHLGQARRQVFEAAAVVFAVEQGLPAAAALAGLRQPAAPGQQAQAPALQVTPPAQFIGQLAGGAGQGQLVEPLGGGGGLEQPALHPPGPPLHLFGQGFAGLERQAAPDRAVGFGAFAAAAGLAAARQGEGGLGGSGVLRPQIELLQPGAQVVLVEAERVVRHPVERGGHRRGHPPGVRPQQQARRDAAVGGGGARLGGGQPGGMQQAHGLGALSRR